MGVITQFMDDKALLSGVLPEGLRDGLPPQAAHRDSVVRRLQDHFGRSGYDLVAPPLVEFEDALRGRIDAGQGNVDDAFRLLDPVSQRTLVVRSDITRQVARIATTRMSHMARPLRLSYTGSALLTRGTQLQPSRQVRQVGLELIGSNAVSAVEELANIISSGFDTLGLRDVTFDLAMPGLIPALCRDLALSAEDTARVKAALDDKDAAALADLPGAARTLTTAIMQAIGPAEKAVEAVSALNLQGEAGALWSIAKEIVAAFSRSVGAHRLHLDPGEVHGFSYQAGWALSVFANGIRGELGRGGGYILQGETGRDPALGFTFYPDVFADFLPVGDGAQRIYVSFGTPQRDILKLQDQGYITVRALSKDTDIDAVAASQNCNTIYKNGAIQAL